MNSSSGSPAVCILIILHGALTGFIWSENLSLLTVSLAFFFFFTGNSTVLSNDANSHNTTVSELLYYLLSITPWRTILKTHLHVSSDRGPTLQLLWPPRSPWDSSPSSWPFSAGSSAWWKRNDRLKGHTDPVLRNSPAHTALSHQTHSSYPKRKDSFETVMERSESTAPWWWRWRHFNLMRLISHSPDGPCTSLWNMQRDVSSRVF